MAKKSQVISDIFDDIRKVCQVLNEQSKRAERETGITGPQLYAIKLIKDMAPVRVCDLASRMYLHPATVIGILDRLQSKGFINRVRSKQDRRVVKVELTRKGKNIVQKAPEAAQSILVRRLEKLPIKKLQEIALSLDLFSSILSNQELPSQLIHSLEVDKTNRQRKTILCC